MSGDPVATPAAGSVRRLQSAGELCVGGSGRHASRGVRQTAPVSWGALCRGIRSPRQPRGPSDGSSQLGSSVSGDPVATPAAGSVRRLQSAGELCVGGSSRHASRGVPQTAPVNCGALCRGIQLQRQPRGRRPSMTSSLTPGRGGEGCRVSVGVTRRGVAGRRPTGSGAREPGGLGSAGLMKVLGWR